MKRIGKIALALALGLILLGSGLIGDYAPVRAFAAETEWTAGTASAGIRPAEAALQARSRKKKNSAPTATPAPAVQKDREAEPAADPAAPTPTPIPEGPITDPQSIADYLFSHDMTLPDNFITKKEARALGWDSSLNYVSDVAPGKSIGGDYFGNYEGRLPVVKGVSYHEADCNYTGGRRNADRIIYSTDGRVWVTRDHYNTFEELFPTVP